MSFIPRLRASLLRPPSVAPLTFRHGSRIPPTRTLSSRATDSPTGWELAPIQNVERMGRYSPGGYYAVNIRDSLHNDRYRIVHKLGHGTFSTVWLANDTLKRRYVALKIGTGDANFKEASILESVAPQSQLLPPLLDRFTLEGPNGKHPCYTTIPARMTVSDALDASDCKLFQLDVARALAAQMALAVSSLHDHGLAHGDLHLDNMALRMTSDMSRMTQKDLYDFYGQPRREEVVHLEGKPLPPGIPTHGILPVWLGGRSEDILLPDAQIILVGFGEAFYPDKEKKLESRTPALLRPPEARFEPNQPLGLSSDIWTLACSMWEVLGQGPLFKSFFRDEDVIAAQQIETLRPLLPAWWKRWEKRGEWFTEAGEPIKDEDDEIETLEDKFKISMQQSRAAEKMPLFDPEEERALLKMFRSMLVFAPESRSTIGQVINSEWMHKWALPAYYELEKSKYRDY
ncbi:unnamed protein product [Clonostachys rosea f. rosea IK726]|uniref:Uncharacterized protein n=1 Tax=Clonostachys rosea f. rosea IK726 TaxID=1349383 RepID=A0ACA9TXR7_BIOOC|nr:unnamed protein product [Clonostachys rosea f. rosea IK726]